MPTFRGKEVTLSGKLPEVGSPAPEFKEQNLAGEEKSLPDYLNKPVLMSIIPDLSGGTCQKQTLQFAAARNENYHLLTVTTNKASDVQSFLDEHGLTDMEVLVEAKRLGKAYGLYIEAMGVLSRAVFVIDKRGAIRYAELVDEIVDTPDFTAALRVIDELS